MLSWYQEHLKNEAMMNKLYGESDRTDRMEWSSDNNAYAKRAMKAYIKSRRELKNSFCSSILIQLVNNIFCCFKKCCNRCTCFNIRAKRYNKFKLALDRLKAEQDI